ncbi:MerR family transcriptional regulator [Dongia deserti]|uniref:MerR family transcriptional regulator n=1 Tax=Dongia deserti TaxID=2268030 RepID=UPI000E657259|nr:MerR family transcriptional regulator [Dongia deserti]
MSNAKPASRPEVQQTPQAAAQGSPRARRVEKSADAFRTISEVADELEVPQHVLRFWETKFAQIRPLKRGGGRRYYRPEDIDLLRAIRGLLYDKGYTIKGVQKLIREGGLKLSDGEVVPDVPGPLEGEEAASQAEVAPGADLPLFRATLTTDQVREVKAAVGELAELRDRLRRALEAGKRARN